MPKRRANGEGNIRKRKDGRWEGRYTAGYDPESGKRIIKNVLGHAVVRNRCRRRLREVYRLHTPELKQGYDIILVARVRTAHAPWPEIQKQFLKLCRKLDLLEEAQ